MTTAAELIARTRMDYLRTGTLEQMNKVSSVNDDAITFTYELGPIKPGARISIGMEDMFVWTVAGGSQTATVERAAFATQQTSPAAGDLVLVNPRWSDAQILRAMNVELASLSSPAKGLYRMATVDITSDAVSEGYDLAGIGDGEVRSVWQVRWAQIGPETDWPLVQSWEYLADAPRDDFPSGQALFVRSYTDPGRTIRVWFKAGFDPVESLSDDIEDDTGLQVPDLLSLGAGIRLTAGREIARNLHERQGDTRRAAEVPTGAQLQAMRGLIEMQRRGIGDEMARLRRLYPDRWGR